MDAELRDLISKFQSLQRSESTTKVNDRNVVEIVNILQRKKRLIDIIFTTDGKEFLTWSQLRTEIVNEISAVGGRMNIVDLATPLNVDMVHIERCIPSVMEDVPNTVMLGGEIIFQSYVDSLIQDAADTLKEKGFLLFSDLARSYQLPSTFLTDLLTRAADDGRLHAVCHDAALYTKQYVNAQRMLLRSALLAATKPVQIQSAAFLSRCDLYAPLLTTILDTLAFELPGRVEGGTYVPAKFEQERDSRIRNVYLSNGYIVYTVLADAGISNPKRYLQGLVNAPSSLIESSSTSATAPAGGKKGKPSSGRKGAATSAKGNQQDTISTILQSGCATDEFPDSGYALSKCFLSDRLMRTVFITDLEALQNGEVMFVDLSEKLPGAIDQEADWEVIAARTESLFPFVRVECISVLQGKLVVSLKVLQNVLPRVSTIAVEDVAKMKAGKERSASVAISATSRQKIFGALATALKCQVDAMGSAIEELLARWEDQFQQCFADAAAAAAQRTTLEAKRLRSDVESRCASLWAELSVAAKGASWCTSNLDDTDAIGAVHKSVLQSTCLAIARLLVVDECLTNDGLTEKAAPIIDIAGTPATVQQIRNVVAAFEKKRQAPFLSVLDAAQGKTVDGFVEHLVAMNASGEFKLSMFHTLNKKVEREAFAALRQQLMTVAGKLSFSTPTVAASYAVLVSALVLEKYRALVYPIPGKAVQAVVARVAKDYQVRGLIEGRDLVVRAIRQPDTPLTDEDIRLLGQLQSEIVNKAAGDASASET